MAASDRSGLDIDHLRGWIGNEDVGVDMVGEDLARKYHATFDYPGEAPKTGEVVPRLIHFCLAQPAAPTSGLGPDGHPARGGFLPPVPLPRRMWAGGAFAFSGDLRVGDIVRRVSRIADVVLKEGRTGPLCFVTVEHRVEANGALVLEERQDIVYREMTSSATATAKAPPPPPKAQHRETHVSDPVLLFRYSALTFNGHRIHYDRDYVTKVEGYPGLIFHGPLQASFIVEFAAKLRGGKPPKKLTYRGVQPLFEGSEFSINANDNGSGGMDMWTANAEGQPTMKGTATW